jgi:hypothetical protein
VGVVAVGVEVVEVGAGGPIGVEETVVVVGVGEVVVDVGDVYVGRYEDTELSVKSILFKLPC